jgi:tetratricopeptide (TPR) repeat protein
MRILLFILTSLSLNLFQVLVAQDWTLKLKSTVELRTWRLTSRADKSEKSIQGASIVLHSGNAIIKEVQSDLEGNFEIEIPAHGDFYLTVSYPGCNTKKFYVSTKGIPDDQNNKDFKPSVKIGGFMMSKPFKGVDYLGLEEPLLKVEYKNKNEGFDKDQTISNKGIDIVTNIMDAENVLIEKFCNYNKLGDDALNKKNYVVAKGYYQKALELIPKEEYPLMRLEKAEDGIKETEAKKEAAAEEKAAQAAAAKLANEKAIEEKKAKEKAMFDKAAAERIEKEKAKAAKNPKPKEVKPATHPATVTPAPVAVAKINTASPAPAKPNIGKAKRKVPGKIGTDKYYELVDKGDEYFKDKRYEESKKYYEEAIHLRPNDPVATKRLKEINVLLPK